MTPPDSRRNTSAATYWAGASAFLWYAFGALPLQIAVSQQLGHTPAQTSSWIFIVWFGGAVSTVVLSLLTRQPIPITWTIPGLVYLGTLGSQYAPQVLAGATMMAGVLMLILAGAGVGSHIMRWLPLPIVMGMFAGSILRYVTGLVEAAVTDPAVAGIAVVGYMAGRLIGNPRLPPVGLAVVAGGVATALTGQAPALAIPWSVPAIEVPAMSFSPSAFVAVSLPLVVLAMGLGNVQGMGFLMAQGYPVPVNRISVVVGINSILNAALGGPPATVGRTGVAILAGPEAGPAAGRYRGTVLSAGLTMVMALAAVPLSGLLTALPGSLVVALAGLAILAAMQQALEWAFGGGLRFGALVGFAVAATSFTIAGITSAFWALVAGLAASAIAERRHLLTYWRERAS